MSSCDLLDLSLQLGNQGECNLTFVQLKRNTLILLSNRLPGPPLTRENSVLALLKQNVTVGLGIEEQWSARNLRFDVAWVSGNSFRRLDCSS